MKKSLLGASLTAMLYLSGCAPTPQIEIEWIHDDPNRVLQSDTYDCETAVMQRRGGDAVFDTTDICSKYVGIECHVEQQVQECLIRKFGWTRIARTVSTTTDAE